VKSRKIFYLVNAFDRPDICARVFNIKKNHLIDLIVKQKFFGEVTALCY